jgi:protein SCO1/2
MNSTPVLLRRLPLIAFLAAVAFFAAVAAHASSCCKPAPEPKPEPKDACCAAMEKPAAPAKDACCAGAENRIQPAGPQPSKIENAFTRTSLYQADGTFTDDSGKTFRLAELRGRPVVVNLFFATCGYACPLTVTDLLAVQSRLTPGLRQDTVFVLVSFDLERDTVAALAQYRAARQLDGNWILLRGDDASVRELAALLGVKYKQEADGSFAHSNVFTILNREGEIVHQRTGLSGGLDAALAALTQQTAPKSVSIP